MKLIGIEEHFLTTEVKDAWSAIGLEAADPSVAFHGGPLEKRLADLAEERLSLMDETGLDVQVLSLTTPSLHDLGPDSVDLARRVNDAVAEAVARHPDRFQALATLPVRALTKRPWNLNAASKPLASRARCCADAWAIAT